MIKVNPKFSNRRNGKVTMFKLLVGAMILHPLIVNRLD